jgi:hypothetical protein
MSFDENRKTTGATVETTNDRSGDLMIDEIAFPVDE